MLTPLRERWDKRGSGVLIGSSLDGSQRLTHLLFADDTTILARSKRCLYNMLLDIQVAFEKVGLRLNAGKCRIQTNAQLPQKDSHLQLGSMKIPYVRACDGFCFLGIVYSLIDQTIEFE